MWGESSKTCENNCQCSGLITENFRINSGNNATKRRRDEGRLSNFKLKMSPHTLNLSPKSPTPSKRRVLGLGHSPLYQDVEASMSLNDIENIEPLSFADTFQNISKHLSPKDSKSPYQSSKSPLAYEIKTPTYNPTPRKLLENINTRSPLPTPKRKVLGQLNSPMNSPAKAFGDLNVQSPFKFTESPVTSQRSFRKISKIFEDRSKFKMAHKENIEKFEEETRDAEFQYGAENWTATKLDFTDVLQSSYKMEAFESDTVPEKEDLEPDFDTLHDLEEEFDSDNFDQCSKYEIISTDSPDIISRGRNSSTKVTARSFVFGAPLADSEQSTSFNRPNRALNFEDMFEFPSPAIRKTASSGSVKKSLKFNETPTRETSLKIFTSESTASMESGFVSEFDEQFLDMEESSSPKVANFDDLLSGQIKSDIGSVKPPLCRSKSFNPAPRARVSLLSILESPRQKRSQKRSDPLEAELENKRRKCEDERSRPVLQRAFSENNASIMSAMDRSDVTDLIGDFSQPFALPLTSGHHSDLKSISCDTLAALIRGDYKDSISEYQVIDCRYPYEFEGGHVAGARNLYTPALVLQLVRAACPPACPRARRVLVFHCEFSLERGPKLSRFLRSSDREQNKDSYPSLHYPEVYLLHEGYRAFYQRYPQLCAPAGYTAMLAPEHRDSLRRHRSVQQPSSSTNHRKNRLLF